MCRFKHEGVYTIGLPRCPPLRLIWKREGREAGSQLDVVLDTRVSALPASLEIGTKTRLSIFTISHSPMLISGARDISSTYLDGIKAHTTDDF